MRYFHPLMVQADWTLFLDRDGVINQRIPDQYVSQVADFKWIAGAIEAIKYFKTRFAHVIVVTNQAGIGKALMTEQDLQVVHDHLRTTLPNAVDLVLHCPHRPDQNCSCRKPKPGMAIQSRQLLPSIDFRKSVMVGDSRTDLMMGRRLGMGTVYITTRNDHQAHLNGFKPDQEYTSLAEFAARLRQYEVL